MTPLVQQGIALGTLGVYWRERRPSNVRHVPLLETFADQAVIAIENTRLFGELRERVDEL